MEDRASAAARCEVERLGMLVRGNLIEKRCRRKRRSTPVLRGGDDKP